jgi:hypothetical protein
MLIWYAHDARPYSMLALAGAVSLWMLARVYDQVDPRAVWWWGGACAATVALHYYGVFVVGAEAVALLLLMPAQRRRILEACIAPWEPALDERARQPRLSTRLLRAAEPKGWRRRTNHG